MKPSRAEPVNRSRRLALQLALMTAVIVGSTLGAGIYLIEQQREQVAAREVSRARSAVAGAAVRWRAALDQSADEVVRRIESDPASLRQLIGREPLDRDLASRLAREARLEVLEIASESGLILASAHWPDREGLPTPYPPGGAPRASIDTPQGPRTGWFRSQELNIGQYRMTLLIGRFLDKGWLDEAAAFAEAGWWVPAGDEGIRESSSVGSLEDGPSHADVRAAVAEPVSNGGDWRMSSIPWTEGETTVGHVVLALRGDDDVGAWRRLRGAWAGLTLVAALAAALVGLVLGRRLTRPVDQLVRAVDAIAAGHEDYDFPGIPQDEFDELVASFSRLQRSLEQQQRRSAAAERVAAWQEVARHVAHEVKNPLAPIRLTVQNLERARETHPEAFGRLFEEGAQTILEEVDQLSRLVGEFSEFARLPVPELSRGSLEPLIDEVLELYSADATLTIERVRAEEPLAVSMDRDQIARVFKNIVGNAVEAMDAEPTRTLGVETGVVEGYAEISFSDNGPGFAGDADRRVFEPYFTTKSQGTGLGMAISYRMVSEHGGEILAENRPEGGARVTVRLPLSA